MIYKVNYFLVLRLAALRFLPFLAVLVFFTATFFTFFAAFLFLAMVMVSLNLSVRSNYNRFYMNEKIQFYPKSH